MTTDSAKLSIFDSGPGIPENERQTLKTGEETELRHANRLGLWLAHWVIEASGGELGFTVEDRTTVVVSLPLAEDRPFEPERSSR